MRVLVGLTLSLPEVALLPDQAPEAVQAVALPDDQVSVLLSPALIEAGVALRLTVGAAGALATVTVTERLVVPCAPVQLRV